MMCVLQYTSNPGNMWQLMYIIVPSAGSVVYYYVNDMQST